MRRHSRAHLCLGGSVICFLLAALLAALLISRWCQGIDDLVIVSGRVFDGEEFLPTGTRVAIRGGKIRAMGPLEGLRANHRLDAAGQVVAPGFIDVHTHIERQIPDGRPFLAASFARQGITTLITGNCGTSKLDLDALFRSLARNGTEVNIASLVGHNTVREEVMGKQRSTEPATPQDIAEMQRFVERAMRDGALGLSTGLAYAPGVYATEREVIALAQVAGSHRGLYVTHLRDEGIEGEKALEEAIGTARAAGLPLHVSHIKIAAQAQWGQAAARLVRLQQVRKEGLKVTYDVYAYSASSTTTEILLPSEFRGGTLPRLLKGDPATRERALLGMLGYLRQSGFPDYGYATIASFGKGNYDGMTIPDLALKLALKPTEEPTSNDHVADHRDRSSRKVLSKSTPLISDLTPELRRQMEAVLYLATHGHAQMIYHDMSENDMVTFLCDRNTSIGSDSGVRYEGQDSSHPRGAGNFVRILGEFVRVRASLSLEEALRKMTSMAADTFGLEDVGRLRVGFRADIVVFDPETVDATSDYGHAISPPRGIHAVFVRGQKVVDQGRLTGRYPGVALRRRRESR
jgi:N-acyl-D-amino-acid deacylase